MTATVVVFLKGVADFRFVALCVVYDFWSFAGEEDVDEPEADLDETVVSFI